MNAEKAVDNVPYFEHVYAECACGELNHVLSWKFHQDVELGPELYFEVATPLQRGFLKRLWSFMRGNDCAYIGPDHVYTRASAEKQRDLLDRYLLALDRHEVGG